MSDVQQTLSTRQALSVLFGVLVSVTVLGWAFYQVDLRGALRTIQRFGFWWTLPMLCCYLSSFLVRGIRWQLLLQPVARVSWRTSTGVLFSGYMANNLLPLRLGEIVRAVVLGQVTAARVEGTLSTIVLERVFDGLVLVGIIALVVVSGDAGSEQSVILYTGVASAVLFAGALAFVIAARLFPRALLKGARWMLRRLPIVEEEKGLDAIRSLLRGLLSLALNRRLVAVLGLSGAVWLLEGGMFWVGLYAFDLSPTPLTAGLTLALVNLSILLPSAPGYVGVFQGGTIIAFAAVGLSKEAALSYSIVVHTLQYVSVTIIGLAALSAFGISLSSLRTASIASAPSE